MRIGKRNTGLFAAFGLVSAAAISAAIATPAYAQEARRQFDIPAQSLSAALIEFSRQSDVVVSAPSRLTRSKTATAVRGSYTHKQALDLLLEGTGLVARQTSTGSWVVSAPRGAETRRPGPAEIVSAAVDVIRTELAEEAIVVTGTRLEGTPIASPVTVLTQGQIREAGQSNLGEALRSLPQNFSGGQNPGVIDGNSATTPNADVSGASAPNLRGLGPDATLTLVNGKRLAFNGRDQGVDVSAIPLAAVDRVEIVADGASAVYGSDAVAGVVNVILRRDYDGLDVGARVGTATGGGGTQQQYSIVGGSTWRSGGVVASYEYSKTDAVLASERDFLAYMPDPTTILPQTRRHAVMMSMNQTLLPGVEVDVDGFFNTRTQSSLDTNTYGRLSSMTENENYLIAPGVQVSTPIGWTIDIGGTFGRDQTDYNSSFFLPDGTRYYDSGGCYCNTTRSVEISAEGQILSLPAGAARMAVGSGYRRDRYLATSFFSLSPIPGREGGSRSSHYIFGEVFVPLISQRQDVSLIRRLSLSASARYERYNDFNDVITPRVGVLYSPTDDLDVKLSFGESFKAPTLQQTYLPANAYLYPAQWLGGSEYPATAAALLISGGNADLRPERATNLTGTISYAPPYVPGLRVEVSYGRIEYKDRVLYPVSPETNALSDPVFAEFVIRNPSISVLDQAVALDSNGIVSDFTGLGYDPDRIIALILNQYQNTARQRIRALDASVRYRTETDNGTIDLHAAASWLDIKQRNSTSSPEFRVSGFTSSPASWRARAGATWSRGGLTASTFINHIGSLRNRQTAPESRVKSFTTLDVTAAYQLPESASLLSGMTLGLSIHNLTDENPPRLSNPTVDVINYDATNHSPLGRFISLSAVMKLW